MNVVEQSIVITRSNGYNLRLSEYRVAFRFTHINLLFACIPYRVGDRALEWRVEKKRFLRARTLEVLAWDQTPTS